MASKNCWGCGELLERVTDEPFVRDQHAYCDERCFWRARGGESNPDYPVDYDEQDRRAASEERLANLHAER